MKLIEKLLILTLVIAISGCSYLSERRAYRTLDQLEVAVSETFESDKEWAEYLSKTESIRSYIKAKERANSGCDGIFSACIGEEIIVTATKVNNPEITNNQEAGVDEGDIVKVIGDYFVMLRQGKLFSVRYGGDWLIPIDSIPVIKPGWEHEAWIDELLVFDNTIVVIGYAYEGVISDGTVELHILQLGDDGAFIHENSYIIQSDDYFSAENYTSRVVDGQLIFSFPVPIYDFDYYNNRNPGQYAVMGRLPENPGEPIAWQPLLKAHNIYKPTEAVIYPVLHVYVKCQLERTLKQCSSSGVIADQFQLPSYVTTDSIYVTTNSLKRQHIIDAVFDRSLDDDPANLRYTLHRIDLDTMKQASVPINGIPFNQFSFAKRGDVLYLVTAMNNYNDDRSDVFLNIIDENDFQNPSYLPNPYLLDTYSLDSWLNTRFVGDWLAIGDTELDVDSDIGSTPILALHHIQTRQAVEIVLEHSAERLEPLSDTLFVLGYNDQDDLHGSIVALDDLPRIHSTHYFEGIVEAEYRNHAFNSVKLRNDVEIFGFTAQTVDDESNRSYYYDDEPSDIHFIEVPGNKVIRPVGKFESKQAAEEVDDDCTVSCIDWYGNTRPFFLDGKIYGLTGYELIQGEYFQGVIRETSRVDYRLNQ